MALLVIELNGFELPINVTYDNEYEFVLKKELNKYIEHIEAKKTHGLNSGKEKIFEDILCSAKEDVYSICKSVELYYAGDFSGAKECIKKIICKFNDDKFIVSSLGESYAVKGMCNFPELMTTYKDCPETQAMYEKQRAYPLNFFKARDSVDPIEVKDMLHIPFEKRSLVSTERFSMPGIPCVYLASTSLGCWLELNMPDEKTFWVSAFDITNNNLKVLNLCVQQCQINGACVMINTDYELQLAVQLLKIFPLVCATSFTVSEKNRNFKSEYIISQLLMQSIKEMGIDAIAYNSKKIGDMSAYPQCVNLAIPAIQEPNKRHSNIGKTIQLTRPTLYKDFLSHPKHKYENQSYINKFFPSGAHSNVTFLGQTLSYSQMKFSQFDDFLIGQDKIKFPTDE